MAHNKDFSYLFGTRRAALTVSGVVRVPKNDGHFRVFLRVRCDCGTRFKIPPDRLGKTKSCGCQTSQIITASKIEHGHSRRGKWTAEYKTYVWMIARCENPNVQCYPRYGGRGIRVCARWRKSFEAFLADVGPRPSPQHSIDRFPDNDGDYKPGNVRWATRLEQAHSRRTQITALGKTKTAQEWAASLGISAATLLARLRSGWHPDDAVSEPLFKKE